MKRREKGEGNRERKRESAEETWEQNLRPKRDDLGKAKLEARKSGTKVTAETESLSKSKLICQKDL